MMPFQRLFQHVLNILKVRFHPPNYFLTHLSPTIHYSNYSVLHFLPSLLLKCLHLPTTQLHHMCYHEPLGLEPIENLPIHYHSHFDFLLHLLQYFHPIYYQLVFYDPMHYKIYLILYEDDGIQGDHGCGGSRRIFIHENLNHHFPKNFHFPPNVSISPRNVEIFVFF